MFVVADDRLLVNEIAPRPHNSGHYTIDACVTSQFEQQVRVLTDLPFGDTRLHGPAVMINLLGDIWFDVPSGAPIDGERARLASGSRSPRAKLHLYGKDEARRGRKMGHVTCLAPTLTGHWLRLARSGNSFESPTTVRHERGGASPSARLEADASPKDLRRRAKESDA